MLRFLLFVLLCFGSCQGFSEGIGNLEGVSSLEEVLVEINNSDPSLRPQLYELAMKAYWVGRSFDELIGAKGQPSVRHIIPGRNMYQQFMVHFGESPFGCIDGFNIMGDISGDQNEGIVRDYFCR